MAADEIAAGVAAAGEIRALAAALGACLGDRALTMATAESCTGGLVAAAITGIAGSSEWFDRGFVTYSNAAKSEALGVPAALIARHGAVSEPVAAAMAEGALATAGVDAAVSVTGVAGPGGGTADKPVGMVCFGWALRGRETEVETAHLPGDRAAVREASVSHALRGLLERLDSYPSRR